MKSTENVKTDFKALREKAGLTLEALARKIDYSVAAINGLENNGAGSQRLRNLVVKALTEKSLEPNTRGELPVENRRATLTTSDSLERARVAEEKLARVYELLAEVFQVLKESVGPGDATGKVEPAKRRAERRRPAKPRRTRLRDVASVSLRVFSTIPAGWPQNVDGSDCAVRYVEVPRGRFPDGAFGLDVRGDSMNAATPEPILDGETVILLASPEQREPRHHDIVAALCDGQTTLKRLWCPPGKPFVLRAESNHPAFARDIVPVHDLTIQGVVVGKL